MSQSFNQYSQQPYQQYQNQPMASSYQPNYLRPAQSQMGLKGRPVSSFDEVRATPIDFDGTIFIFPNFAGNQIYTKQINMDGTATMIVYEKKEYPYEKKEQNLPPIENFVTREEFESALGQIKMLIEESQKVVVQQPVQMQQPSKPDMMDF